MIIILKLNEKKYEEIIQYYGLSLSEKMINFFGFSKEINDSNLQKSFLADPSGKKYYRIIF